MTTRGPALIVHGGAGADAGEGLDELRDGMRLAAIAGWAALDRGSALDAVEAAVRVLEDHPRFDAGRGSVLTSAGTVEMDASIMEGAELRNGAVAAVRGLRHPVSLARRILESERHALFVGAGAEERAHALGIPACDPAELITDGQRLRLAAVQAGTVGAVALDRRGTVAAATSNGGMAGKLPGRVGDSADRLRDLRAQRRRRRLVHRRRRGDHPRRPRPPRAGSPRGRRRPGARLPARRGPARARRARPGRADHDRSGRTRGLAQSTTLMPVAFMTPDHAAPGIPF